MITHTTKKMLLRYIYSAINILSPSACLLCEVIPARFPSPLCRRCEQFISSGIIPPYTRTQYIQKVWTCRFYKAAIIKCVHQFKYRGKTQMINVFKKMFPEILTHETISTYEVELVISVPLHKKRLWERGYNQSEIIAKKISKRYGLPFSSTNLIKTKHTSSQMTLSKKLRLNNLADSFSVRNATAVKDKKILLVDDVMTTGATLNTCAGELLKAGAKEIFAFTLAKTE